MFKSAALKIPQIKRLWQDRTDLLAERDALQIENERLRGQKPESPFFHYNCSFDALATITATREAT